MRPADKSSVKGEEKTREEEERTIPDMSTYHRMVGCLAGGIGRFHHQHLRKKRTASTKGHLSFLLSFSLLQKRKRIELMECLPPF